MTAYDWYYKGRNSGPFFGMTRNDKRVLDAVERARRDYDGFIAHGSRDWIAIRRLERAGFVKCIGEGGFHRTIPPPRGGSGSIPPPNIGTRCRRRIEKMNKLTFEQLQQEQREWSLKNFGPHDAIDPLLGAFEELGELAHAVLKQRQGIRGTAEEHEAAAKDAVADTIIFLADYCTCRGWDLGQIVAETWAFVRQRDWTANKKDGGKDGGR